MIIDGIKKYFKDCPLLKGGKLNVDYLGEKAVGYSIEPEVCKPIIRQYVDGASQKQYIFNFVSREYLDENDLTNLENHEFYEKLERWISSQCDKRIYPDLGEGKAAQHVECLTHGYSYAQDGKTARYQLQCRVIYLDK